MILIVGCSKEPPLQYCKTTVYQKDFGEHHYHDSNPHFFYLHSHGRDSLTRPKFLHYYFEGDCEECKIVRFTWLKSGGSGTHYIYPKQGLNSILVKNYPRAYYQQFSLMDGSTSLGRKGYYSVNEVLDSRIPCVDLRWVGSEIFLEECYGG